MMKVTYGKVVVAVYLALIAANVYVSLRQVGAMEDVAAWKGQIKRAERDARLRAILARVRDPLTAARRFKRDLAHVHYEAYATVVDADPAWAAADEEQN
jgi:hypothetical protein